MAEWHVYDAVDAQPVVFENEHLLWQYLNNLPAGAGVTVQHYERILRDTKTYGAIPGASPLPPNPANPPPSEKTNVAHIKAKKA